jgi:glycyl-tRNA synthetase beta chain
VDLLARDPSLPGVWELAAAATEAYEAQGLTQAPKPGDLAGLLAARLRGLLEEKGTRYDLADALLATPWDNIASVAARADALSALLSAETFAATAQVATRVRNILRTATMAEGKPDGAHLTTPEEKTLLAALDAVAPQAEAQMDAGNYAAAFDTLAALNEPINRFFDGVLVMAEDPAARQARLALLARADRLYLRLADFSKLVSE